MNSDLSGCTIVFDLDGTLVETAYDLQRALNVVLAAQGLPAASVDEVKRFVGLGARGLIVRAFAVNGLHPSEAETDRLTEDYTTAYASDIAAHSAPFPGVEATLGELRQRGAVLCVCTNKRTYLSVQLLDALGMSHWFAAVVGRDKVERPKPHPDHFLAAVRAARGDPARAMMVGDSSSDVGSAKAAGAPVIVFSEGYTDTAPELLGADAVFRHFNEVPGLAETLLRTQLSTQQNQPS